MAQINRPVAVQIKRGRSVELAPIAALLSPRTRVSLRAVQKDAHMAEDKILFTIRDRRTLPAETWDRFAAATRRTGSTPAAVLRQLIERYLQENDTPKTGEGR